MPEGILVSGSVVCDIVVRPVGELRFGTTTFVDSIEQHLGGNGANTASALGILGTPVRLLGYVGSDEQARFVLDQLERNHVGTELIRRSHRPTAATVAIVNAAGDRNFLHRLGVSAEAFAEPLTFTPDLTAGVAHYHLASLFVLPGLREHAATLLAGARAAGLSTSLDTNWDPHGRWLDTLAPCLPHLDYLFMNEDEARMVTGSADPATAAAFVRERGVGTAVMKLSRAGCAIFTADGETRCPAYEVECLDTTGAGDCFVAGFLTALQRGASLAAAGSFANAVGALNVQQTGAVTGVRSYDDTVRWQSTAAPRR